MPLGGDQLYYVHHRASGTKRGGVVIAPPFASERSDSYLTCARWARQLAAAGFDALRFDYRGIGESTGDFRTLTLPDRREDVLACAEFLKARIGGAPLVLHGMRLSAVFTSELFAAGLGDALLLWAPPTTAQDHLYEVLRFTLTAELVQEPGAPRRTRDDCVRELESGGEVNVGGYFWTQSLWRSAADLPIRFPAAEERRPWRTVDVRFKLAAKPPEPDPHRYHVACGRFWEESLKMTADVRPLTEDAMQWLDSFAPGEACA
jgi:hypothetical protein